MRKPPTKLDIKDAGENPDCMNVLIFLRGEKQDMVVAYDKKAGTLTRHLPYQEGDEDLRTETITFDPEDLELRWMDESRVQRDGEFQGL